MTTDELPQWYRDLKARHPTLIAAVEDLGEAARQDGPLDAKTAQLVQLAAAVAIGSEGAAHSHARRAIAAGADAADVRHAITLLTSTIGFPRVSAALSWVDNVLK